MKRKTTYKRLAIIGNGFDMAHSLPTGYPDFVASKDSKLFRDFQTYLKDYCGDSKNWSSFEERINDLTLHCFFSTYDGVHDPDTVQQDIEAINALFQALHTELSEYLLACAQGKVTHKLPSVKKILNRKTLALNFNYTDTAEHYLKDIVYVHGSLAEQDIVLGYDFRGEPCLLQYDLMRWSKQLCRQRLAYHRYLKNALQLDPKSSEYREAENDIEIMEGLLNSSRGFEDEDWNRFKHPEFVRAFFAEKRYSQADALIGFPFSKIREIVVLGHSLSADENYLNTILRKCRNLKKVIIFTYHGETRESFEQKASFFRPYCKKVIRVSY